MVISAISQLKSAEPQGNKTLLPSLSSVVAPMDTNSGPSKDRNGSEPWYYEGSGLILGHGSSRPCASSQRLGCPTIAQAGCS